MPWYAWLIIVLALGPTVGRLLLLCGLAKKLPLSEEQLKRIHKRNTELGAQEVKDR